MLEEKDSIYLNQIIWNILLVAIYYIRVYYPLSFLWLWLTVNDAIQFFFILRCIKKHFTLHLLFFSHGVLAV